MRGGRRRSVGVLLGVVLVGGGGNADPVGIAFALASAGAYSAYILVSDRLLRDVDPLAFAALLTGGAATSFALFGASTGEIVAVGGWPRPRRPWLSARSWAASSRSARSSRGSASSAPARRRSS